MRCIDADTLEKILEKIPAADIKNMGGQAYVLVKLSQVFNVIDNQPTIEPRCETCEAFNKTRLLIPQPQRKGRWIDHVEDGYVECPFCHSATNCDDNISDLHFCFSCGARMEGSEK